MYTLFRNVPLRNLLSTQAPALMISLVIAELFYKFHSFTLECVAFLVTWFVVDALAAGAQNLYLKRQGWTRAGRP
jgi:hypothetical protein